MRSDPPPLATCGGSCSVKLGPGESASARLLTASGGPEGLHPATTHNATSATQRSPQKFATLFLFRQRVPNAPPVPLTLAVARNKRKRERGEFVWKSYYVPRQSRHIQLLLLVSQDSRCACLAVSAIAFTCCLWRDYDGSVPSYEYVHSVAASQRCGCSQSSGRTASLDASAIELLEVTMIDEPTRYSFRVSI